MAKCIDCIHQYCCKYDRFFGVDAVENKCNYFKNKADVVEVKHGKWKEHFSFDKWHYDCPFCDFGFAIGIRQESPPNYCENCGAKMDGKINNLDHF